MGDVLHKWSVSHCISIASAIEGLYAESGVRHQHHLEFYEYLTRVRMSLVLLDGNDVPDSNGRALSEALHGAHERVQQYLQRSIAMALLKRRWEQRQLKSDRQAIDKCLLPIVQQQKSAAAQLHLMPVPPKAKKPKPKFISRLMAHAASALRAVVGAPRIEQGPPLTVQPPEAYTLQPSSSASQPASNHATPRNHPRPSPRDKHIPTPPLSAASRVTADLPPRPASGLTSIGADTYAGSIAPPTPAPAASRASHPTSTDSVPGIPTLDIRAAYWAKASAPGSILSDLSTPADRPGMHPFSGEDRSHALYHRSSLINSVASVSTPAVPPSPATTASPIDQHSPEVGNDSVALAQPPKMQDNLAFRTDSDLGADTLGADTLTPRPGVLPVAMRAPVSGDTGTPINTAPRSPPVSECSAAFSENLSRPTSGVIASESELEDQPGPMLAPSSYPEAPSGRTSLPWICDQLSMNWQGQVVDLRGHCVAPAGAAPPMAGPLVADALPMLPAATPVHVHMARPASRGVGALWELQPRPADAELWTVASVGTTLRNGRIELPDTSFLVLDSTCEGFTMQNIVIRGWSRVHAGDDVYMLMLAPLLQVGRCCATVRAAACGCRRSRWRAASSWPPAARR
eukprot:jgi/Ulvmu1/12208/UM085_0072.1